MMMKETLRQMGSVSEPCIGNRAMFGPDVLYHYFQISSKVNLR